MVARTAGSFLGGIFNNPGIIIIAAVGLALFIFRDKISEAFASIGQGFGNVSVEVGGATDEAVGGAIDSASDFFGNLGGFFEDFFGGITGGLGGGGAGFPPDVEDIGLMTDEERAACECGTNIIQDIQGDVSETCIPCEGAPGSEGAEIIGGGSTEPICIDVPNLLTGGTFNTCTGEEKFPEPPSEPEEPEPPFEPPIDLPPDFEGGGVSFEGGTIFETPLCNKSIGQIAAEFGISASAAANMKFIECEQSDFDFGTNTGSGFGAGDDQSGGIVTGGATLESEEKRAACVTCELFGLNCPICAGTI